MLVKFCFSVKFFLGGGVGEESIFKPIILNHFVRCFEYLKKKNPWSFLPICISDDVIHFYIIHSSTHILVVSGY